MPASTGAVGRAGSARAVHATASASGSRSTWSFTGCLLPVMFAGLPRRGMSLLAGLRQKPRGEPTCSWDSLSYKNVVVIGAVDGGDNVVPPAHSLFLCTAPVRSLCRPAGRMWTVRKFSRVVHWSSPGFPRVVHPFVHRPCPQVLDNPCGQPVS